MKLIVKGNSEYYQSYFSPPKVDIKSFIIEGDFKSHDSPFNFVSDRFFQVFEDKSTLINFSKEIKGKKLETIPYHINTILKKEIYDTVNDHISLQEIGMIKAVFLIYQWLEYALSTNSDDEIKRHLYNEFTLDYNEEVGPQKDIYFINQKYKESNFVEKIKVLIDINLLCSLTIETDDNKTIETLFIPLIKPGVKREYFINDNGIDAYFTWKEIISGRNNIIHNFLNR